VEEARPRDGAGMTRILPKDGKTRTSTWRGKNAEGKDVHNVVVFDKK
jgi:hypothetical protein